MDITHVREFLSFCESMNYSVAARELFCSRSALRQHIVDLESELGVPLVEQVAAGHRLTVFGQRFKPEARRLVGMADSIASTMAQLRRNLLVVSVSSSSLAWLRGILFQARANIIAQCPEKQIQINTIAGTMTSTSALAAERADIAVFRVSAGESPDQVAGLPEGSRAFKVASDTIRYFTGTANPLCRLPRVGVDDLRGQRLLVTPDIYESYLRHFGPTPGSGPFGMQVVTRDFADYQEYYAGDFSDEVATVPSRFIAHYGLDERPDLKILDIEGLRVRSDFYAACTPAFLENPTAKMLFDEMESLVGRQAP